MIQTIHTFLNDDFLICSKNNNKDMSVLQFVFYIKIVALVYFLESESRVRLAP